jgi:lipoate-protein ligase A
MAWDEALLEAMPRLGKPVLRFYGWTEPAASFGYFQKHAEVAELTPLRPLLRRPTGGGIVPHATDWTYSVAFPTGHEWYRLPAIESYRRIHEWLRAAFGRVDVRTQLAPEAIHSTPGQCFSGCERFDLLRQGRKIAGAAQRRRRDGLLIQGSVQPAGISFGRDVWEKAMIQTNPLGGAPEIFVPGELEHRALRLAQEKYSQAAYNQKR